LTKRFGETPLTAYHGSVIQRKTDAYEHPGTPPRTREGPSEDSSSDDLEFGTVAVVIAVIVLVAVVGIFVYLLYLLATVDFGLF